MKPFVVGQEQRGVAAGPRGRKGASAAVRVRDGCRRRQVPEREPGESGARADEQRLLEFGQRDGRVRGPVAERALRHLEAETEASGAPAVERLAQRVAPRLVDRCGRGHAFDPCWSAVGAGRAGLEASALLDRRDGPVLPIAADHFFPMTTTSQGWADLYAWQL